MRSGLCVLAFIALSGLAEAQRPRSYAYMTFPSMPVEAASAQGVAEMQARYGQCRHFGGNSGYEGVGYSAISPDHAVRSCCFWGQRTPVDIGVARGRNGWFACVRYR